MLAIIAIIKVTKKMLQEKTYNFDLSTSLLMKQRDIRRMHIDKAEKIARLAEVELEVEKHLADIETHIANDIAESKYQIL